MRGDKNLKKSHLKCFLKGNRMYCICKTELDALRKEAHRGQENVLAC